MNRHLILPALSQRSRGRLLVALIVVVIGLILTNTPRPTHAASGNLDSTFGVGGKVVITTHGLIYDLAIQPDGKIVAVGTSSGKYALVRFNPDGSLDSTFGADGYAIDNLLSPTVSVPTQIAIQTDGKILIGGWGGGESVFIGFALARFNSDGTLDQTFGTGGKVVTGFFGFQDEIYGLAIQPDGKIVAAGRAGKVGVGFLFAVARYNSDGSLDTSFADGGKFTYNFSDPRAYDVAIQSASELAIQNDGRIVVIGTALSFPTFYDMVTVRLTADGVFDTSFGGSGFVLTDFASNTENATTLIMQPDGKIIVGGSTFFFSQQSDFALVRFDQNGALDPSFGTQGRVHTDFAGYYDVAYSLALLKDGRIALAGKSYIPSTGYDFAIALYNKDGSLDTSFGNGGKEQTDFFGQWDIVASIAVQNDGKLVAGGLASSYQIDQGDFALARYNVEIFDLCIQDDSNGNLIKINTTTGDYRFSNCRKGWSLSGTGIVTDRGCKIEFQDIKVDRNVTALINVCTKVANSAVQVSTKNGTFTIADKNITNNTGACK